MFLSVKYRKLIFLILFSLLTGIWVDAQPIGFNEFMSSNAVTIADEDGDFSDWIEIYYNGAKPISLSGYGLSDDEDEPFRWIFPEIMVHPEEFLFIWASGKNRTVPGNPLHTNFSIKAEGEKLFLTHPNGTLIAESPSIELASDLSFGHIPDGSENWFFFSEPTPGVSNSTQGYSEILSPPVFSNAGGFYYDAFELVLSHPDPEVIIIYTTDGSAPDTANLNGSAFSYKNNYPENPGDPFGEFYTGAIQSYVFIDSIAVIDRSAQPDSLTHISTTFHYNPYYFPVNPVFKGATIRAAAFKTGALPSIIATNTFFICESGRNRYSLPVVTISTNKNDLFDYEDGIYTAGTDYDTWRTENPEAPHNWQTQANFHRKGNEWEKRSHFEYFDINSSSPSLTQEIGIRIHGNEARRRPMKSLRLYACDAYGESYFNNQFFTNVSDTSFKRLILRNSGQDYYQTLFRDAMIQTIYEDLNFDTQASSPIILFINGEYWGIHNIRERYDKYYLQRVYGVDPDNLDYITNLNEISEGDMVHYNETINYIAENGLADEEHYQYIQTRIDVDNFRDYQIANIYADNHDWPGNNLDYWRLRTNKYNPDAPYGQDGRWRWMMYDMDFGFGLFGVDTALAHNTLAFAAAVNGPDYPNPEWATFLLRSFLENEFFKISFINRFADLLNTALRPNHVLSIIDECQQTIEPEIPEHILRWKNLYHINHWHDNIEVLRVFANLRPDYQRQHILEYFQLAGIYTCTVDVSKHWHGHIRVNTIEITDETPGVRGNPYPWSGIYYQGVPVELEAIPSEGYAFSHWEGDLTGAEAIVTITPDDDFAAIAHFVRVDVPRLVYFWLFDTSLPNDTPLETISPTYQIVENSQIVFHSALAGYPFEAGHPNWRKASMERRNDPTPINYRPKGNSNISFENSNMKGIQIKQPFTGDGGENTLIYELPTTGLTNIVFSFAAKDEGAAEKLIIEYSTTEKSPDWSSDGLANPTPDLGDDYQLYVFNFEELEGVNENPDFKIRIRFFGENMAADEGNRVTFNNFTLDGLLITPENLPPVIANPIPLQFGIEAGVEMVFDLNDYFMEPDNDSLYFSLEGDPSSMAEVAINGNMLTILPQKRGDAWINLAVTDSITDPIFYSFRVLIYPKAFPLHNNKFSFDTWNADEPEYAYPDHTLFMQSDMNDPELNDPLLFPYFIPHDDYHTGDQSNIGFPYQNSYLTRINGLGDDGIALINSGQGRDLGGVLLAIDTREVSFADISWLASTIHENDRTYAVRLQYRTDITAPFSNLLSDNLPIEYTSTNVGNMAEFEEIPLQSHLLGIEYMQLLWKYYFVEGNTGERAQIRLDDIIIKDITFVPEIEEEEIKIFSSGGTVFISSTEKFDGSLSVFDISGRIAVMRNLSGLTNFQIDLSPRKGVFVIRIVSNDKVIVRKLMLN